MKKWFAGLFIAIGLAGLLQAKVLVDKTFDNEMGKISVGGPVTGAFFVNVEEGKGSIGTDPAVHFLDDSTTDAGILEYCAGDSPAGAYFISFDLLNNVPVSEGESMRLSFGAGPWADGNSLKMNSNDKRVFSIAFDQAASSKSLSIRYGADKVKKSSYDLMALQQVKIWVNDNDKKRMFYIRPDTQQIAVLNPNSFIVWINNKLVADQPAEGLPMLSSMSAGDAVLGRFGFYSTTTMKADFWIDNLHIESVPQLMEDPTVG